MTVRQEWDRILVQSRLHGVDPLFMASIRKAENGGPGREFGVLGMEARTFQVQLEISVKTIRRYLSEFMGNPFRLYQTSAGFRRLGYSPEFITYAARRYAPIGAENDPTGLNHHWERNVSDYYRRFTERYVSDDLVPQ